MSAAPTADDRCGTYAGAQAHKRRGEWCCEPCLEAQRTYIAEYRKDPKLRQREVDKEEARRRAWVRLARMYPTDYRALYAEESAHIPRKKYTFRNRDAS